MWRHLVAKFCTNASGATWWPNFVLMQEFPTNSCGATCLLNLLAIEYFQLWCKPMGPLCLWQCFCWVWQISDDKIQITTLILWLGPCLLGCGIAAPPPWDFIDQRWNNRIWGPGSLQRRRQQITCFQKHESILIISILISFRSIYVPSSELWKMFFLWSFFWPLNNLKW